MRTLHHSTLALASLGLLISACSGPVGSRYMAASRRMLVDYGEWELDVETEVLPNALVGVVHADGCLDYSQWSSLASTDTDTTTTASQLEAAPPWCDRFGLADALVLVRFGDQEVQVRTDSEGRFSITDAVDLSRLVASGDSGSVAASHSGRSASARVVSAGLSDAAALASLDAMDSPSLDELTEFLRRFAGTPAGELALSRHYDVACGELADAATAAMRSGDIRRAGTVVDRFDSTYEQFFCGVCSAECASLTATRELLIDGGGER